MGEIPEIEEIRQAVKRLLKDKRNKVVNLSDLAYTMLPFHIEAYGVAKSIAADLKETGKYEIDTEGAHSETIYFVKRAKFHPHPVWFPVLLAFIGAVFGAGGGWLIARKGNQDQTRLDSRQDTTIHSLFDSLTNLQTQIRDSAAAIRSDTSFLRK